MIPSSVQHIDPRDRQGGVFPLFILTIFSTEVVLEGLLTPLFARLDLLSESFLDAALLTFFILAPINLFFLRPLSPPSDRDGEKSAFDFPLLGKLLAVVFFAELSVMFLIPLLLPGLSPRLHHLVDGTLTAACSAPLMWRLFFKKAMARREARVEELIGTPCRLYLVLLFMVFLLDLLQEFLSSTFFPSLSTEAGYVVDSVCVTTLFAPVLWFLVARPLTMSVRSERARVGALCAQVIDAIVITDAAGVIESVNPAAERIFGYGDRELCGRSAEVLFHGGQECLTYLLRDAASESGTAEVRCHELIATRRDGSLLTMDSSVSRVAVRERQEFLLIMRDISENRRAQLHVSQSLSLLSATLESTADAVVALDLEGRVRTFNGKFLEMWRLPREVVERGEPGEILSLIAPQVRDQPAFLSRLKELNSAPELVAEERVYFRDGRVFEANGHPQVLEGEVVGRVWSFSDISEKFRTNRALKESEARFRQIFDRTDDAIVFFKPESCMIIDANRTAESLFGRSRRALINSGGEGLVAPEELSRLTGMIRVISGGGNSRIDCLESRRKDGSVRFLSVRGKLMPLQGVEVVYCTFRDITERIRLEEEAREMQSRLIQVNKMASLGLLVSGVAHEVNNPNNFILASAELLAQAWGDAVKILEEYREEHGEFTVAGLPFSQLSDHSAELFAGILDGSRRIKEIINNLKSFARQEQGAPQKDVDLNKVVLSSVTTLHYELSRHTERFHLQLAPDLPPVKGSSQQLGQVTINLLMNACQALPSKSCGIWLSTGLDAESGQVLLMVRDEGCGMTREQSQRVLEPFFTTKLDSGGTGLGLAICNSIVKEHGGVLEFHSEPGAGSTFTVKLPAASSPSQ